MKMLLASAFILLLSGCAAETKTEAPAPEKPAVTTTTQAAVTTTTQPPATTTNENQVAGTFVGQVKVDAPFAMFNYVGPESGDFAPMRFDANSVDIGQKILAVCGDDDECEFTGVVEWLDEPPPENASAIGKIIRVDSVRRIPGPNEQ